MVDQGNVNVYIPDYRQKAVHVNVYINITNFPVDVKWLMVSEALARLESRNAVSSYGKRHVHQVPLPEALYNYHTAWHHSHPCHVTHTNLWMPKVVESLERRLPIAEGYNQIWRLYASATTPKPPGGASRSVPKRHQRSGHLLKLDSTVQIRS